MHDSISELAKSISGEFVCRLESTDGSCEITRRTRHFSYVQQCYDVFKKFETLSETESLRTFLPLKPECFYLLNTKKMHDLIERCKCLRVLSLANYYNVKELPKEIGTLKHLRHLNMTETFIKSLPNTLSTLYYLQTLLLFKCRNLVELPNDMRRLINLHYLDIRKTKIVKMPEGMGELKGVRMLTDFVISEGNGSTIRELGKFEHLRGRLAISGLENVEYARDVKVANLNSKEKLAKLKLMWMDPNYENETSSLLHRMVDDPKPHRKVLEQLEPHTNLKSLVINFYGDIDFPVWMGHSSFSNLLSLKLMNCEYCVFLPPIGQLSSLKSLSIKGLERVVIVGEEFYGQSNASCKPFRCLEILRFEDMAGWGEWSYSGDEVFLVLKELHVKNCPKLSKSLPEHLPSLTKLEIEDCGNLGGLLPTASRIFELSLVGCDAFQLEALPYGLQKLTFGNSKISDSMLEKMLQHCPHIEELGLWDCCDLKSLPQGSTTLPITLKSLNIKKCDVLDYSKMLFYTSLKSLVLRDCNIPEAVEECFPLPSFPMLKSLHILRWEGLKSVGALPVSHHRQLHLPSLIHIDIDDCPNLIGFEFEEGLSATNMTTLSLRSCKILKSLPEQMQSLFPSLGYLSIQGCPEIESFPKGGLPTKLKTLVIWSCDKLIGGVMSKRNREWSLQSLSSLTHLYIGKATEVEIVCFPDEHLLPSSLTSLSISDIPNLKVLDDKGFQQLSSLLELEIDNCPKLQSMPEKRFLTSLFWLRISSCPLLKGSCEKEKGKDWPNISHIPVIEIDYEFIE